MARSPTRPHCPSAQPEWPGAQLFGVVGGTGPAPVVGYLETPLAVTPELLAASGPVAPTEVFRFAAPCMANACQHFSAGSCRLVTKVARLVPAASDEPPPCPIRDRCRWWMQEGVAACLRCPAVVTDDVLPSRAMSRATVLRVPPGAERAKGERT